MSRRRFRVVAHEAVMGNAEAVSEIRWDRSSGKVQKLVCKVKGNGVRNMI